MTPDLGMREDQKLVVWAVFRGSGLRVYVGALIMLIGFWVPLYYKYNKEPAKQYR